MLSTVSTARVLSALFLVSSVACGRWMPSQENWILLAKDEDSMEKWITAINAVIHGLFTKRYNVPEDNYDSQG